LRAPPPFPTRRSSDLLAQGQARDLTDIHTWGKPHRGILAPRGRGRTQVMQEVDYLQCCLPIGGRRCFDCAEFVIEAFFFTQAVRSEEHTSELQSRFDL